MEPGHVNGHLKENSGPNLGGTLDSKEHVHSLSSSSSSSSSSSYSSSTLESDFGDVGNPSAGPEHISSQNTTQSGTEIATLDGKIGMQNPPPESSQMKSPTVQTMGQPPGYDPNRIPLHVFSINGANTANWSATSNESLFSLRMGNNSFTNDYAILFGKSGELGRSPFNASDELPRLDEWDNTAQSNPCAASDQAKSDNINILSPALNVPMEEKSSMSPDKLLEVENRDDSKNPNLDPVASVDSNAKEKPVTNQVVNISSDAAAGISMESDTRERPVTYQAVNNIPDANGKPVIYQSVNIPGRADAKQTDANNVAPQAAPPAPSVSLNCPSPPRCSGESATSVSSFAFPVLVNGSGKVAGSLKGVAEKPEEAQSQPQQKVAEESSEATAKSRRFSCFPCFPQCC